jgi:hypothetical protein
VAETCAGVGCLPRLGHQARASSLRQHLSNHRSSRMNESEPASVHTRPHRLHSSFPSSTGQDRITWPHCKGAHGAGRRSDCSPTNHLPNSSRKCCHGLDDGSAGCSRRD